MSTISTILLIPALLALAEVAGGYTVSKIEGVEGSVQTSWVNARGSYFVTRTSAGRDRLHRVVGASATPVNLPQVQSIQEVVTVADNVYLVATMVGSNTTKAYTVKNKVDFGASLLLPMLDEERVHRLYTDSKGNVYVVSETGLYMHRQSAVFKVKSVEGWGIKSLEDKAGRVYFTCGGYDLYIVEDYSKVTPMLDGYRVNALAMDNQGTTYAATDVGVQLLNVSANDYTGLTPEEEITHMVFDSKNNLYFTTYMSAFVMLPSGYIKSLGAGDYAYADFNRKLVVDSRDNVYYYDINLYVTERFNMTKVTGFESIVDIQEVKVDAKDNLLILVRDKQAKYVLYSLKRNSRRAELVRGLPSSVNTFDFRGTNAYVGTDHGLYYLKYN